MQLLPCEQHSDSIRTLKVKRANEVMLREDARRALGKLASSPEPLLCLVEQTQPPLGRVVRLRAHTHTLGYSQ